MQVSYICLDVSAITSRYLQMITSGQLRAARAFLGMDQRKLAEAAGLSVPTIQRMEASDGVIRGNVESLMKLIAALDDAGIELIHEAAVSQTGGRGVRLKTQPKIGSSVDGAQLAESLRR